MTEELYSHVIFCRASKLNPADHRVLGEIAVMVEKLRVQLHSPQGWGKQLQQRLSAFAAPDSTAIEGFVAVVDDVSDIIVGRPRGG